MQSAVLVIDVQHKIFDTNPRPYEAEQVVQRINRITEQARTARVPVIFVQHEADGFLEYGSDGWKLPSGLTVNDNDIKIRKTSGDAFLRSNLQETLQSLGVTNLIICGYASEFCIDNTSRRAAGLGYTIQLVSDAHTTHDKPHLSAKQIREHHNVTLSMGPTITAVTSSDINFFSD